MLILVTCLILALVWLSRHMSFNRCTKSPPLYPGWIPILGHVHLFLRCDPTNIWSFYKKISQDCANNGGVTTFSLGPLDIFYVTDPEDAHTIANSSVEKNFAYDIARPWLGNGLLTSNGATWKAHRKIMNSAFTQQILHGLVPVFNKQARRLVRNFDSQEETFNPEPLLLLNNLETICKTSLGLDADERQDLFNEYRQSIRDIFEIMFQRFVKIWLHSDITFYFSMLKKKQDKVINGLHNLSNTILEKRKAEIIKLKHELSSPDQFRPLLDSVLELSIDKGVFTANELREELDTIIFGGHDTSATVLTNTLMLLGSDQTRQEKIYREILEVMGDSPRDVDREDLPKLSYLECVIKESLRLYPIGPAFPRMAKKDVKLKNYILRAGMCCAIDVWSIHRNPLWGPDAQEFRPERWQDPDTLPLFKKTFSGFGVGKRTCIGKPYAMMSLKITLVHILRTYKVTADISKLTLKMDSLLRPQSGHMISIARRK